MSGITLAQPDITLSLDIEGIIQSATLSQAIGSERVEAWRGRPWIETVGETGGSKVRRMVDDALRNGVSAYSQFTQRFPSGLELPMEFTTVRLGAREGLLAIGRSLQAVAEVQARLIAAQQAMEQDYWKLREVETRYRMLFDSAREAVLVVLVDSLRIAEANPAAIRGLGLGRGRDLLPEIAERERDAFQAMLARVREQGRAPGTLVHLGPELKPWTVRATLTTADTGAAYLLHVAPAASNQIEGEPRVPGQHDALVEHVPDAFVAVNEGGIIRHVNKGFLDLVQVGAKGAVLGEPLGRWLSHPGADATVLLANLERHAVVRRFATILHGELGSEIAVEISAAIGPDARPRVAAMLIRDVGSRPIVAPKPALPGLVPPQWEAIGGQIGRSTLPSLVAESVAVLERQCIVAALEAAGGNRTEAAEMLGLSRQSLYKKIARYEIDGPAKPGPADQGD